MGWRTQDAYDTEALAQWKRLPLRRRYAWNRLAMTALAIAVVALAIYLRS